MQVKQQPEKAIILSEYKDELVGIKQRETPDTLRCVCLM